MLNLVDCLFVAALGLVGGGPIQSLGGRHRASPTRKGGVGGFRLSTCISASISRTIIL